MSNDIRELHADARSVWIVLTMTFGHPEQVMRYGFIRSPVYRDLLLWLHHLEHLFRRILPMIALGIPSLPYQPGRAGRTSGARARVLFRRPRAFVVLMPGPRSVLPRRVRRRVFPPVSLVVFGSAGIARRFEGRCVMRSCVPKLTGSAFRARSCAGSPTRRLFRPVSASGLGAFLPGAGVWRPWRSHPKSLGPRASCRTFSSTPASRSASTKLPNPHAPRAGTPAHTHLAYRPG